MVSESTEFCPAALSKQQTLAVIGCCDPLFLSSTNFILPLELLIGFFFLLTWQVILKCIKGSLKW